MGQSRLTFTDESKAAAGGQLYKPSATQTGVAGELGVTSPQLKTWPLKIEAAGSMVALRRQQADAAELDRLWKENKRLTLENEILEQASAFFASRAAKIIQSMSRTGECLDNASMGSFFASLKRSWCS